MGWKQATGPFHFTGPRLVLGWIDALHGFPVLLPEAAVCGPRQGIGDGGQREERRGGEELRGHLGILGSQRHWSPELSLRNYGHADQETDQGRPDRGLQGANVVRGSSHFRPIGSRGNSA